MTVSIISPKSDLTFDGEYDPAVAEENDARYHLKCDECGMEGRGTSFDLQEAGWSWEMTIDTEEIFVTASEATCPKCNGAKPVEEMEPHEKAERDEKQQKLGDIA